MLERSEHLNYGGDALMPNFEYRICWSSSSNISFEGETDWTYWGEAENEAEINNALNACDSGVFPQGLDEALSESGFEWWSEIRAIS